MDVFQFKLQNDTSRFSAYNNYYCYDTGHSFELIFMILTCLMRVHTSVNATFFFGNNRSDRTTDMGENVPSKQTDFLALIQLVRWFLRKKFQSRIRYPTSHRKGYIHFCHQILYSLKNCSTHENFFSQLFWKIWSFFEKIVI